MICLIHTIGSINVTYFCDFSDKLLQINLNLNNFNLNELEWSYIKNALCILRMWRKPRKLWFIDKHIIKTYPSRSLDAKIILYLVWLINLHSNLSNIFCTNLIKRQQQFDKLWKPTCLRHASNTVFTNHTYYIVNINKQNLSY